MAKLPKLAAVPTAQDTRLSDVLRLSLVEGLSTRAIARRLQLSRKTVRRLLGRASERQPPSSEPRASLLDAYDAEIWADPNSEVCWKLAIIGLLAIVEAGLTLTVGALSFASRSNAPEGSVAEVCFCPRCGRRLWLPAGEVRCRHCAESFFIELRRRSDLPDAIAHDATNS